jgi:UDP-N-acetylglucosamine:LPS N-acetylglucosamine transferase
VLAMNVFGTKHASDFVMKKVVKGAYKDCMEHMQSLQPDAVVSTHWATNYYAEQMEKKPYTVMYVPDAHANALFRYPCDFGMISMPEGHARALKYKKRFNKDNFKLVPLAIRQAAFDVERDKKKLREKLGHDDKFTVYLTEGGYGVGLTEKLCEMLLEEDLPITIIAVCGKNPEMHARLQKLKAEKSKGNTSFYPYGFCENVLEMIASADLYLGKSGNGLMEPTFYGVPVIVTHSANTIERLLAEHYVSYVKSAIRIFDAKKCVQFIKGALQGSDEYQKLKNFKVDLSRYGGEGIADVLFEELNKKFHVK